MSNTTQTKETIEEHMKLLSVFISMHGRKAKVTKEPVAYLIEKDECMNMNAPLVAWKEKNLTDYFDHNSRQFGWLMKQFKTYDYETQVLLGIIIDKQTILSEVVTKK